MRKARAIIRARHAPGGAEARTLAVSVSPDAVTVLTVHGEDGIIEIAAASGERIRAPFPATHFPPSVCDPVRLRVADMEARVRVP